MNLSGNKGRGINTELCCSWTMDSYMVLGSSLGPMTPWSQLAVLATQIGMDPMAAWPSNLYLASGVGPDSGHSHGLQWQQDPQTSVQTLAEAGP